MGYICIYSDMVQFYVLVQGEKLLHPLFGLLQHIQYPLLSTPLLGRMHVLPSGCQRQAHENALNSGARRVQTESSSTVVNQVELNIAPSSQLLPCLLLFREGHVLSLLNDWNVRR